MKFTTWVMIERKGQRRKWEDKNQEDQSINSTSFWVPRDENEQFGIDFWLSIYKPWYQHSCVSIWKAKVTMEIKRGQWATEIRDDEAQGWCSKFIYKATQTKLKEGKPSQKERNGNQASRIRHFELRRLWILVVKESMHDESHKASIRPISNVIV